MPPRRGLPGVVVAVDSMSLTMRKMVALVAPRGRRLVVLGVALVVLEMVLVVLLLVLVVLEAVLVLLLLPP